MREEDIKRAADNLFNAEKSLTQIGLISSEFPEITLEDAYAIQEKLIENKLSSGLIKKGWKIGLTSKAMQTDLLSAETELELARNWYYSKCEKSLHRLSLRYYICILNTVCLSTPCVMVTLGLCACTPLAHFGYL